MDNTDVSEISNADFMKLKIISPEDVVFDGEAKALELENDLGPFSVFPYHETFITIIKSKVIVFDRNERQHEIPIEHGIIKIYLNKVEIFLGLNYLNPENPLEDINTESGKKSTIV